MSPNRAPRSTTTRRSAKAAALAGFAALAATTPSSASTATFFPRGSNASVDRQHVTVAVGATSTVAWSAIDIGGDATDVGVIVAVKAGGRVELTARTWIDVVENATGVIVSTIAPGDCTPLGIDVGVSGEAGAGGSGTAGASASASSGGGCNGGGTASVDAGVGGGCWSQSSEKGGCNGCSCEPSQEGHPGCSALPGCAPADSSGSSGSSGGGPDGSASSVSVGPYDLIRVRASDGSALSWLDANGYDPGLSFVESVTAVETGGYELYALRARPPTSSSVVRSLRVVTTSPTPAFPLRLLRTGASSRASVTPLTLVVLANGPQTLVDTPILRVDSSKIASTGGASNYESLVAALLGAPPGADAGGVADAGGDGGGADGGAFDGGSPGETRWLLEASRSLANRRTVGDAAAVATLADTFAAQCKAAREVHTICGPGLDLDAAATEGGVGDASDDASGVGDAEAPEGGAQDGGAPDGSASDCTEVDRQSCDDIDLAIPSNGNVFGTRFRAMLGGDPASIKDLVFAASTDAIPDGNYVVRNDGQPGLCEPTADATGASGATVSGDAQATCIQTRTSARSLSRLNFGPAVLLLVAIRAVTLIMRRGRGRRR